MSAILEVKTAVEGFRLWPGALDASAQADLVDAVFTRLEPAPLYRPQTPGGRPFSVRMSNFGPLGWVSDRGGYRYQATHPETGRAWPDIPPVLLDLWEATVGGPRRPDACLVNLYREGAKMGLHQDKDEADLGAPVPARDRPRVGGVVAPDPRRRAAEPDAARSGGQPSMTSWAPGSPRRQ